MPVVNDLGYHFGDGLAEDSDLVRAAESAVAQAVEPLEGRRPDLLCFFVCGDDPDTVEAAGLRAMEVAGAATSVGCSAGGVIGGGRGVEATSAVSAWAACLPGVRRTPLHLEPVRVEDRIGVSGMPDGRDDDERGDDEVAMLLADPYTFPVDGFVQSSGELLPGLPLVGGMASGAGGPGSVRLFIDGRRVEQGAVGVLLGGQVAARALVSQGCRPVGPPMTVTKAANNMLLELAGVPALSKLEQIIQELPPEDQQAAMQGLHIGIAMDEYAAEHERGDFLVRGVVGADRDRQAIGIGDVVEVGRTVRFQVRDAVAADEDLAELFSRSRDDADPVGGALLFSCNGRGTAMFPSADHDVQAVRSGLGIAGVAGFFAAGEIGPVGGRNHLHGFTASILAFGARSKA
ncbi:MAG: histidine kinase [Pseudonocardiaceae bacterium]|nr:histidine kinase [Pseudonocardiaceae bacterium]